MATTSASRGAGAYLTGVGEFLPGAPVDNGTMADLLGLNADWIDHFIGNRTRHYAVQIGTGTARYSLAQLAERAARGALERAGTASGDIEFIVMATATPDHLMPATVNTVADLLGINLIPTYQIQSGCAGAVQALDVARLLVDSGRHVTGLVIAADITRKHLGLDRSLTDRPAAELVNAVLFGDGAGAAVISSRPGPRSLAIRAVLNELTGLGRAPGQTVEWFGLAEPAGDRPAVLEDYKTIEREVPVMATEIVTRLLDELDWSAEDVAYLLPPQLSGRMTAQIVDRIGLPAKAISRVDTTGNTGNALPLLQLAQLFDVAGPGERALVVAVESSKWIKAGLGLERVAR